MAEFSVYPNSTGGYHIAAYDDGGGVVVVQHIDSGYWADHFCRLANANVECLQESTHE